jgi:hypothetical protein
MRQLLHLILLAVAALVASAEPEDDGFELRQLTEDNFRSSTSQGLWCVQACDGAGIERLLTSGQACGAFLASMCVRAVERFSIAKHSGSHCRAFAPTWTELARDKQHLERLSGFHMAQVNCIAQGGEQGRAPSSGLGADTAPDLCNSNGIKFCEWLIRLSLAC